MKQKLWKIGTFLFLSIMIGFAAKTSVYAGNVTVVIDPGHGGENLGAQWNGNDEKDLTLIVAKAMKAELDKYEGIDVYLTRDEDVDMTLQKRADFAKKVNADFLYSLHFNMSEYHTLYGTEIWISAFDDCYAKGYAFGEIYIDRMTELGLYNRGIKTRLNQNGIDYYGVIRACTEYGIPSGIIEHFHLDREEYEELYATEEKLQEFGKLDATAVAQYFRLSSKELGIDYSDYPVSDIPVPDEVVKPDLTPPENCELTVLAVDERTGNMKFSLSAEDKESGLLYYSYTLDGGKTFSELCMWDTEGDTLQETITIPYNKQINFQCKVLNGYDIESETEMLTINAISKPQEETVEAQSEDVILAEAHSEKTDASSRESTELMQINKGNDELQKEHILLVICLILLSLLIAVFWVLVLSRAMSKKKKRRHNRR